MSSSRWAFKGTANSEDHSVFNARLVGTSSTFMTIPMLSSFVNNPAVFRTLARKL
ncbi:hypothetical protein Salmuc_01389 [Salipiger mucosus DSM 16094]|uniref:Uncharacterized protein n=1 Tax=Salipiger mucosus DSM 16094 TaxID=1123237 RepID=S9QTW3_9RHOB|nr:hypothetical protein Salmuc_01389 [Salipiger mucosus DSM 16094]